ncbi:MAG TPA: amidohydrolase family protein [Acidimicrobiia bacterium]|nr:amidohydrolase family protein [Acidimicrobiia bacterium]
MIVDIHSHLYPPWFVDWFRQRSDVPRVAVEDGADRFLLFTTGEGKVSGPLLTDEYTSVGAKLAFMDRHGIDRSIVSLGNPWLEVFDPDEAFDMAREANARMASLSRETAGRIFGMGVLPPVEPHLVAEVVVDVARRPGLRGVIASTKIGQLLLDDAALDPVWKALNDTRVPVMIHPMIVDLPADLAGYGIALSAGIGFPFQTTMAMARLLLGEVLERHPHLRVLAVHGGGALPYLIGRLEGSHAGTKEGRLRESARRLLLDAALYEADAVRMAASLVGAEHLLFGTDHPFPNADVERISRAIDSGLTGSEKKLVMGAAAASWYDLP